MPLKNSLLSLNRAYNFEITKMRLIFRKICKKPHAAAFCTSSLIKPSHAGLRQILTR